MALVLALLLGGMALTAMMPAEGARPPRSAPGPAEIQQIIRDAAERYGIDAVILRRLIKQESWFDPLATNGDCKGLGQVNISKWAMRDWADPYENANKSAEIMRFLVDRYHGNYPLALAAYNWGHVNVDRLLVERGGEWMWYLPWEPWYMIKQVWAGGVGDD